VVGGTIPIDIRKAKAARSAPTSIRQVNRKGVLCLFGWLDL
jgi:hypothetical protein